MKRARTSGCIHRPLREPINRETRSGRSLYQKNWPYGMMDSLLMYFFLGIVSALCLSFA